jgi:hypothetical protein
MELLTQFLHIKDEPMAAFIFLAIILYKILSLVFSFIQHKYFEKPDISKTLTRDIAILKIYSKDLPIEERMDSLFDYLYAGFNGAVLDYGKTELILRDKETWGKVYSKKMEKKPEFNPKKNFEKAIEIINKTIFDMSML